MNHTFLIYPLIYVVPLFSRSFYTHAHTLALITYTHTHTPSQGANPDINHQTPLHLAVERRNIQIVRLLVEEGANPDLGVCAC